MMGRSKQAINDSKLIKTIRSNNASSREKQSAFDELFSTHERQLRIYFMKKLRGKADNLEDSSDLVMMTFEKIYKKLDMFDSDKGVFSTWMYQIAKNTFIDYVRKDNFEVLSIERLSSKASDDNDGMDFQIESDVLDPEQATISQEGLDSVHLAIDSIDNDFIKELMRCRYIDDLSFEETAEKMQVPNNSTLRVNVHRGIELLKDVISQ